METDQVPKKEESTRWGDSAEEEDKEKEGSKQTKDQKSDQVMKESTFSSNASVDLVGKKLQQTDISGNGKKKRSLKTRRTLLHSTL